MALGHLRPTPVRTLSLSARPRSPRGSASLAGLVGLAGLLVLATGCGSGQVTPPVAVAAASSTAASSTAASSPTVASSTAVPSTSVLPTAAASVTAPSPTVAAAPPTPPTATVGTPPTSPPTVPTATPAGTAEGGTSPSAQPAVIDRQDPVASVAGPDGGARCADATSYSDEADDGLVAEVRAAWEAVRATAVAQGTAICLADGKRSWDQQVAIAQGYVDQHGVEMARKYALPPETSMHVRGYAVDVQPAAAYTWLEAQDGSGGFCRMYDNEPWHFEWSAAYVTDGCPSRTAHPAG